MILAILTVLIGYQTDIVVPQQNWSAYNVVVQKQANWNENLIPPQGLLTEIDQVAHRHQNETLQALISAYVIEIARFSHNLPMMRFLSGEINAHLLWMMIQ